ncbi:hypothetical protein [Thermogemmatispora sp.]|uniref:hypothetical protein n=1 Tax=Thermogemmatispora sp. TaxID=1968838 RepID=UPI0035E457B2
MGDLHELLIVPFPHLHFLLPERVLPYDERANALLHQQSDDATAGRVQVPQQTAIALRRDAITLAGGTAAGLRKFALHMGAPFVVARQLRTPGELNCSGSSRHALIVSKGLTQA